MPPGTERRRDSALACPHSSYAGAQRRSAFLEAIV